MKAVIFANGEFAAPNTLDKLLGASELLLAADGGLLHMRTLGLQPDAVVGDLDSLDEGLRTKLKSAGVKLLDYPEEKDQTDLELALLYAKDRGAKEITILAGLGRRWDHSLSNLQLLAHPEFAELRITYFHGEQRLFLIRGEAQIEAQVGARLSLIPLGGDATGVHTRGLAYALRGEKLLFGSSRGVSNVVVEEGAWVSVESGLLLCVISPSILD